MKEAVSSTSSDVRVIAPLPFHLRPATPSESTASGALRCLLQLDACSGPLSKPAHAQSPGRSAVDVAWSHFDGHLPPRPAARSPWGPAACGAEQCCSKQLLHGSASWLAVPHRGLCSWRCRAESTIRERTCVGAFFSRPSPSWPMVVPNDDRCVNKGPTICRTRQIEFITKFEAKTFVF